MTFRELSNIIRKHKERHPDITTIDPIQKETEEAKALLEKLRTNSRIAYQERKKKWFEEHPGQQYFTPSLEETRKDTKLEEWSWDFVECISSRTPEQRYQDRKCPDHGWNHLSKVHTIEEECKEGCRLWPKEGKIYALEILEDYKEYDRYDEVRKALEDLPPH
jgi:hypothetical protein